MNDKTSRATHCASELERCDREISDAAGQHDKPAYLVTLGIEDWECEKRLLMFDQRRRLCPILKTIRAGA